MPAPLVINRRPDEGDEDVSISTPFRFGVRDADTRADLSTVYCAVTCARTFLVPDEDLPSKAVDLAAADVVFSNFDDASGAVEPGNPCDQTLVDVAGTTVYRIEKADVDGTAQEGTLFLTLDAQEERRPYSVKVRLDLAFVTATISPYAPYTDYVGVVIGFVYWPENTGIFLFFRDDGAVKRVAIVGPSTDGAGTRSVEEVAVFDWTEPATYTIFWDASQFGRVARVFATGDDGEETLLAEVALSSLNTFLPSTRMGDLVAEDEPTGKVTALVGLDGSEQGNYIDVYALDFANFGRVLLYEGAQTGSSSVETTPSALIEVVGTGGADEWGSVGDFTEETTSAALHMTATAAPATHAREEPDLSRGEWVVVGKIAAENATHPGTYTTGMGVLVEDGTRAIRLSLLDDFARITVGIDDADADDDDTLTGYRVPAADVDWEDSVEFTLVGSLSRDVLRLYLSGEDEVAAVDVAYTAPGYTASTATALSFGVVGDGEFSGDFYLVYLWVFPNCTLYEPAAASYPDDQGWSRASSGGTRDAAGAALAVDCTTAGAYDVYYIDDATYDAESGAAVIFKAEVSTWTDASGAASPLRSEFGPIASIRTTTVSAQVRFIAADDGTTYVFLSNEESDYQDVLAQNTAGRAISAEIDLSVAHVYLLDVRPFQHVRLYLDYATEPAIEAAWPSAGTLRELPTYVPSTAVIAWGSLNEDAGVACTFAFFRGSVGRGYDFKVSLDLEEDVLVDSVYGSHLDVAIDVEDED